MYLIFYFDEKHVLFIRNMIFQTKTYYDIEQVSIKNHVLIIYPLLYI
jgi:hypothetical protein